MYNPRGLKFQEQGRGKDLQSLQNPSREGPSQGPRDSRVSPHYSLYCGILLFFVSNSRVPPESPPWQGLTLPGDAPLPWNNPSPNKLQAQGRSPALEQAWLEFHSSSSYKTEQILRRAELKSCSFYITPSPALAHLH